jgi:hypothetical protein
VEDDLLKHCAQRELVRPAERRGEANDRDFVAVLIPTRMSNQYTRKYRHKSIERSETYVVMGEMTEGRVTQSLKYCSRRRYL